MRIAPAGAATVTTTVVVRDTVTVVVFVPQPVRRAAEQRSAGSSRNAVRGASDTLGTYRSSDIPEHWPHDANVKPRLSRAATIRWLLPISALSVLFWLAVGIFNLAAQWGPPWLSILAFVLSGWASWDTWYWWGKRSEIWEEQREE